MVFFMTFLGAITLAMVFTLQESYGLFRAVACESQEKM
jgi:hypothetical protein